MQNNIKININFMFVLIKINIVYLILHSFTIYLFVCFMYNSIPPNARIAILTANQY